MSTPQESYPSPAADQFEICEIRGGFHHGERVNVPKDQDSILLYDNNTPHRYHRLSLGPVFHVEDRITQMFGGKR